MSTTTKATGPVAAALAALALIAPASGAMPIHESSEFDPGQAPSAIAKHPRIPKQLPGPQMWVERSDPAYELATSGRTAVAPVKDDDGTPWATIVISVAGAGLLIGSGSAIAGRARVRTRRARMAA